MLDIGFTELLLIGTVALVVIGPEKLPKVARTVGHLIGRAQRYVSDVKSDIQREVQLDELRKLRTEVETAAREMQKTVTTQVTDIEKEFREAEQQFEKLAKDSANENPAKAEQPESSAGAGHAGAAPSPNPAVGAAVLASASGAAVGGGTAAKSLTETANDLAPPELGPESAAQVVPLAGLGSPVEQSRDLNAQAAPDPLEQAVFALHDAERSEQQLQSTGSNTVASTQAQLPGIEPAGVSSDAAIPVGTQEKSA